MEHCSELYSRENVVATSALDAIEPLPIIKIIMLAVKHVKLCNFKTLFHHVITKSIEVNMTVIIGKCKTSFQFI